MMIFYDNYDYSLTFIEFNSAEVSEKERLEWIKIFGSWYGNEN